MASIAVIMKRLVRDRDFPGRRYEYTRQEGV
jgi:hypothetical protein